MLCNLWRNTFLLAVPRTPSSLLHKETSWPASDDAIPVATGGNFPTRFQEQPFRVIDHVFDLQPEIALGAKGGCPKKKTSPERKGKRTFGWQFKWLNLRLKPWYSCPICGEPKQAETVCRKLICREKRP